MLKVLIVDDEPANIQGLVRYIDWSGLGYEAPAIFESGEEAMEALNDASFDVLISDVSMPGMNGIELVDYAKKSYPHIQVLMISGYNEFEFVQDAINVGAQAYVLKPLKLEEVSSRLKTFWNTLDKMRQIVEQTNELEHKVSSSYKLIKERFVNDLIAEMPLTDELLASWGDQMKLPTIERGVQALVFGIDYYWSSGREAKERMLMGSTFKQMIEIGLSDYQSMFLAQTHPDEVVVLYPNPTVEELVMLEKQLTIVQRMMGEQYNATVTIGRSRIGSSWEEASLIYREVKFVMTKARLVADGQIVEYENSHSNDFKDYRLREEWIPNIIRLIEAGDSAKVSEYMNRILELLLSREPVSFSYVQAFGMSFLSELISTLKGKQGSDSELNILMWRRILDCSSANQIVELLDEYVERYIRVEKKDKLNQQHHLVRNIAEFIEERLQENWTVKQLAEHFSLNASYLSVLFKREMGKTISDFVQDVRINRARKLLQDPNIKVYEVADKVGIQTPAYFTYLFKKLVGSTPQEYRDYHYSEE